MPSWPAAFGHVETIVVKASEQAELFIRESIHHGVSIAAARQVHRHVAEVQFEVQGVADALQICIIREQAAAERFRVDETGYILLIGWTP